jgi:hypothetical protein
VSAASVVWQKPIAGERPKLEVVVIVNSRAAGQARQENDMLHRRREPHTIASEDGKAFDDFHEWLLSLPWVVERPYNLDTPGVRCFGVDCEPLGRRQLWLLTGLPRQFDADDVGLAVIVPTDAAYDLEDVRRGRIVAPMPGSHALVKVYGECVAGRQELEALALAAYGRAMS